MSASLVGSEMCIRDSPCACPGVLAPPGSPTAPLQVGASGACGRSHLKSCLLYTSDAADDM
eukprot:13289086-Alexandrium_andersonii.AAC.1